jgi:4a-hydroxytetrahydrobiopterin dehydratase
MTDRINARLFHDGEGIEDWRVLYGRAFAHFRTGTFARGVALVDAIGLLADAADHHPDVDLRYGSVTVTLVSHDVGGLSTRDVELARQISGAARNLDAPADPTAVQQINLTIDALARADLMPFWQVVLGYRPDGDEDLRDPLDRGPGLWFQQMDAPRTERNRMSPSPTTRRRHASLRRWRWAADWSLMSSHRCGGCWQMPRATRRASPPGWGAGGRSNAPGLTGVSR